MQQRRPVMLAILDGWGWREDPADNAVLQARTPTFDRLWATVPHSFLHTSGLDVGLPGGQMGNSEVGHLNIGAGRIVYQELVRVNQAITSGELSKNENLLAAIKYCRKNKKPLHFIGLVSDGGVHSHINHLKALCDIAKLNGLEKND